MEWVVCFSLHISSITDCSLRFVWEWIGSIWSRSICEFLLTLPHCFTASTLPFVSIHWILSFVRRVIVQFDNQEWPNGCEMGRYSRLPRFTPRSDSIHSEQSIRLFNQLTVSIDKWWSIGKCVLPNRWGEWRVVSVFGLCDVSVWVDC